MTYNSFRFAANPFALEDKRDVQLGISGWAPDLAASPAGFIPPVLTCAAYDPINAQNDNYAEYCNPAIDREIAHARGLQTSEPGTASRLWAKIDHELTDQAPWVPFANQVVLEVKSTRLGNYQNNQQWGTLLDQLWVR